MIRASIQISDQFAGLHERVEQLARQTTLAGATAAAAAAQENASLDLELRIIEPQQDPDGAAAGIRAEKTGARGARIARFFDQGTLGKRRKKVKRPGRDHWTVRRGGGSYTAERQDVAGKGIDPQHFFAAAKTAGRKAMAEKLRQGL